MDLVEVFRLTTEIGKTYKHAEYTETNENNSNPKYFARAEKIMFVGKLIKIKQGGFGDGRWRKDIFDNDGQLTEVVYSYEGRTCFIEDI